MQQLGAQVVAHAVEEALLHQHLADRAIEKRPMQMLQDALAEAAELATRIGPALCDMLRSSSFRHMIRCVISDAIVASQTFVIEIRY
jgi:hypothetical protein